MHQPYRALRGEQVLTGLFRMRIYPAFRIRPARDADNATAADRLSVRRASAVAAELEQLGIPNELITVVGFGNKELLAPNTPKDAQNRLVDIELR